MSQLIELSRIPSLLWSSACRLFGFTASQLTLPRMSDAYRLLQEDYQTIETGYGISPDGLMCIAAQVYMPNVTPQMIDWWFGWIRTTEQYKLWHPRDHISSDWDGPLGSYIGGHHLVEELIGGKYSKLKISFESPEKYFGPDWKCRFAKSGYGTAICARTSVWDDRRQGYLKTGHMLHLVKNEPDGSCRMRSRFWLGDIETLPVYVGNFIPDEIARGLMKHCTEEMSILASILPELYRKHGGDGQANGSLGEKAKL